MVAEVLQKNWALAVAIVLGVAIALFVAVRVLQDSRQGRLNRALRDLRDRERALRKASKAADKAAARLSNLSTRGDTVPPRKLVGAKDALAAAQETERLLRDQVLVVRNTARTIILEDFPPRRQDALLTRYLGESR
jgi:uncharacterized membrane protein YccC